MRLGGLQGPLGDVAIVVEQLLEPLILGSAGRSRCAHSADFCYGGEIAAAQIQQRLRIEHHAIDLDGCLGAGGLECGGSDAAGFLALDRHANNGKAIVDRHRRARLNVVVAAFGGQFELVAGIEDQRPAQRRDHDRHRRNDDDAARDFHRVAFACGVSAAVPRPLANAGNGPPDNGRWSASSSWPSILCVSMRAT